MGITSFYFLCFFAILLIVYYCVPKRMQPGLLIIASIFFFLQSGNVILLCYPLATVLITFCGGKLIGRTGNQRKKTICLVFTVAGNLSVLFVLKYVNLFVYSWNTLTKSAIEPFQFLVPLGVSFYTISLLGYIFDVYYGTVQAEKNYFRLLLFGMYFPLMTSGPIVRYADMKERLFSPHSFQYKEVTFGAQRVLWGFFKVLVISERFAIIVNTVFNQYKDYFGGYIILAAVCFSFQLYTNFSGSMDIMLGISQMLGITLPENFRTPFFSKTIQEFWQRWHITLGLWLKDYLFYPILRTGTFMKLAAYSKKKWGKKRGKYLPTFIAMFILWFSVGLWHGGAWKYIFGSGILHWIYIVSGQLTEPFWKRTREKCHINKESPVYRGFQVLRTFSLVSVGFLFFRADSLRSGIQMMKQVFTKTYSTAVQGSGVLQLGLDGIEIVILIVSMIILITVAIRQQKESIREWIGRKNIIVRWTVFYALLFYVILLGNYGPGYSAAEFIYRGF